MSTTMKTPGVYIQELDAFGNAVVPVPTAIPAFIGYTAQTNFNGQNLLNKAVKVGSLTEFLSIFGDTAPQVEFSITANVLPERIDILNTQLQGSSKALTDAKTALTKVGGDATTINSKDVGAATTDLATAQAALKSNTDSTATAKLQTTVAAYQALLTNLTVTQSITDYNADANIKALSDAQTALTGAGESPTPELIKAVKDANATFTELVDNADYCANGYAYNLDNTTINYRMYSSVKFFYENGGGTCYIMSIGKYDYTKKAVTDTTDFMSALDLLKKEADLTMVVIPDLVEIMDPTITDSTSPTYLVDKYANAYSLQGALINHCGEMMDRIAVLDIPGGFSEPMVGTKSFEQFRNSVEPSDSKFNSYAAVYYPWLHTTVYQTSEINYININTASYSAVVDMLTNEFTDKTGAVNEQIAKIIAAFSTPTLPTLEKADSVLQNLSKSYQLLMAAIMKKMNLIAPSAGMAGIYTSVDNNEGVWIAPANVGVQSTVMPAIKIDNAAQEDLNMPVDGKAVCAIRAFTGRGNLVWGARTLDGNSNDWRYINVRRTLIYIEQSIKDACKAYVFAPNVASTWVNVQSMCNSFLTGLWNQGGLAGPKASDAFSVSVGLGSTMTGDDILNGIMRVSIKVAVSHPAEFIELTFQQEMQKG